MTEFCVHWENARAHLRVACKSDKSCLKEKRNEIKALRGILRTAASRILRPSPVGNETGRGLGRWLKHKTRTKISRCKVKEALLEIDR
jgi:hypothetical protein